MTAKHVDVERGFWLRWVLANVAGLAVGWGLWNGFAGAFSFEGSNYVSNILNKLQVADRAEAIGKALEAGLGK